MSTAPVIAPTAGQNASQAAALKAQLADLLALQRSDATQQELARLYAVSVTAYRAANLRAAVVANVPYQVVSQATGEPVEGHPLNALIRDNPLLPDILERSEITACFWGHNLVYKRRTGRRVSGLQWINPRLYRPRFDALGGRLTGFDVSANWAGVDADAQPPEGFIVRADAIYTHGVDFDHDFDGVAPAENAFDHAGIETEAAQTAVWFLRNRAVPAGLLQPKDGDPQTQPPSEAERNAMKRLVNRVLRGARNAGKTLVSSGRWEWVLLQHRFDQVEFAAQHQIAREGVSMAFDVPLDLLLPTSSSYAELYQSNKSWVEYFAKNRCRWYARHLTHQLAAEFDDGVRIVPDFAAVFQRDDEHLVTVTNGKLQGGYLTLYDAQVATGAQEPDARLKDIYLVGGEPVHVERLVRMAREGRAVSGPPVPGLDDGDNNSPEGDPDGPNDTPPKTDEPARAPDKDGEDRDGKDQLPPRAQKAHDSGVARTVSGQDSRGTEKAANDSGVSNETPAGQSARLSGADQPDPDWLPDEVFKELRDCARVTARRGADYVFTPDVLPVDVVAYVRLRVALDGDDADPDALVSAARTYYRDTADLRAMKAYSTVEAGYRAALYDLIRKAFARQIGRQELGDLGRAEISAAFRAAFMEGLRDAGTLVTTLADGEDAWVHEQALAERRHWTRLADEVFSKLVARQREIEEVRDQLKAATDPDEQERLRAKLLEAKQALIAARDAVLRRLDLWAQGLRRIYHQGQLSGANNPLMAWHTDRAKENCRTCAALDGQVHRASEWAALNLFPGSEVLECVWSAKGVPVCGCGFEVVQDATPSGDLARVPLFGPARSLGVAPNAEQDELSGAAHDIKSQPDVVSTPEGEEAHV